MWILLENKIISEMVNVRKTFIDSLPINIWISTDMGDHNNVRIKFRSKVTYGDLIPLRITEKGILLENDTTVKTLKPDIKSKLFYELCDWFIANRDIIVTYYGLKSAPKELNDLTFKYFDARNKEYKKNPSAFKVDYEPNINGCTFSEPITLTDNLQFKNDIEAIMKKNVLNESQKPIVFTSEDCNLFCEKLKEGIMHNRKEIKNTFTPNKIGISINKWNFSFKINAITFMIQATEKRETFGTDSFSISIKNKENNKIFEKSHIMDTYYKFLTLTLNLYKDSFLNQCLRELGIQK